jgi:hypothetical protein
MRLMFRMSFTCTMLNALVSKFELELTLERSSVACHQLAFTVHSPVLVAQVAAPEPVHGSLRKSSGTSKCFVALGFEHLHRVPILASKDS